MAKQTFIRESQGSLHIRVVDSERYNESRRHRLLKQVNKDINTVKSFTHYSIYKLSDAKMRLMDLDPLERTNPVLAKMIEGWDDITDDLRYKGLDLLNTLLDYKSSVINATTSKELHALESTYTEELEYRVLNYLY